MNVVQSPVVTVHRGLSYSYVTPYLREDKYVDCAVHILQDVSTHCFAFKCSIRGVGSTCCLNVSCVYETE